MIPFVVVRAIRRGDPRSSRGRAAFGTGSNRAPLQLRPDSTQREGTTSESAYVTIWAGACSGSSDQETSSADATPKPTGSVHHVQCVLQMGRSFCRRNRMEAKRLGTSLAERLEAPELLSQGKAATGEADQPTVTPETRQILLERVSDFRKRLVIEEPLRRWWQPKNH